MEYDVAVVGGGSAGLAAGVLLSRSRRRVAILDTGQARNAPAAHLHGFLSRDGDSPAELLAEGRREVTKYGGRLLRDRVRGIAPAEEPGFVLRREHGPQLTTRTVLVATGLHDELPAIPGVRDRWGAEVLHCPYCHGHEVSDAPIGVLGGDNRSFTLHQASLVRQWSADVVFFPNGIVLETAERERLAARGVRIAEGEVNRLVVRDGALRAVELADGRTVPRAAVFVGPRFVPADSLLTDLGCAVGDNGWVTVDATGCTSVPGVWAAGNVVSEAAQVAQSVGAGTTSAIAINHHLLADDIDRAVADRQALGQSPDVLAP